MTTDSALYELIRRAVRDELRDSASTPSVAEPEPDMVRLGEVKRWVRVSVSTLKAWVKAGKLPKYGQGRVVLVRLNDVRAVLQQRNTPRPVDPSDRAGAIISTLGRRKTG